MYETKWFHLSSHGGRSINLSSISDIIWNNREACSTIYTSVILGTSISASEVIITSDEDRKRLHELFKLLPGFSISLNLNDRQVEKSTPADPVNLEELGDKAYPELQKDLAAIRIYDTQESPAKQAYILTECDPKVRRIIVERKRNGDPKKLSELKAQIEEEIDRIPF